MKTKSVIFIFCAVLATYSPSLMAALVMPQAPVVTYGYIRNEYGTPMTKLQSGVVELVRDDAHTGRVYARCAVAGTERTDLNYRLSLEIDSATGGRENAVVASTRMFIRLLLDGVETKLSPTATFATPSPGIVQRLDFTTGTDADEDGMPDAWEKWVLALAGRTSSSAAIRAFLPDDDADGDGMTNLREYLAGTDPFLSTDIVKITSFEFLPGTGRAKITFNTSYDRTFRILASPSLADPLWVPVGASVLPDGDLGYDAIVGDGYEKTFYISADGTGLFIRIAIN